jgi:hypothetical protein
VRASIFLHLRSLEWGLHPGNLSENSIDREEVRVRSAMGTGTARFVTVLTVLLLVNAAARGQLANFDSLAEGFYPTVTSGGVTFNNLDDFFPVTTSDSFAIDDAVPDLNGIPGYSPPNVLGFNALGPGPGVIFSRLGSFDFSTGAQASAASLVFIAFDNAPGSTLELRGLLNGNVVNSASIPLNTQFQIVSHTLTLGPGTYDAFKVVAHGTTQNGAVFGVIDNVLVTPIPEPGMLGALTAVALIGLRRARRVRNTGG